MMLGEPITYNEIDFLLPAQVFTIDFAYISQRGLPFIREFVIRLVHLNPMSKEQLATFLGLTRREIDEAIADLVERDELTLNTNGKLTLTEKSKDYFSDTGDQPSLSVAVDDNVKVCFELATFTCFGSENLRDYWRSGMPLKVADKCISSSQKLAERSFQVQFDRLIDKGILPPRVIGNKEERPVIYTVKAATKLRELPLRLTTCFQFDDAGEPIERPDYDELLDSNSIHEMITAELEVLRCNDNLLSLVKSFRLLGDEHTINLFDSKRNAFIPEFIRDVNALEEHEKLGRQTFIGSIYLKSNWEKFHKLYDAVIQRRLKDKVDYSNSQLLWVGPSDPFWGKTSQFHSCVSEVDGRKRTKAGKSLYDFLMYLPVEDKRDWSGARRWLQEFKPIPLKLKGLREGFLDGFVEIIHLQDEFAVVTYYVRSEKLPVSLPIGFITTNKKWVNSIGALLQEYIQGTAAFDKDHDCGFLEPLAKRFV